MSERRFGASLPATRLPSLLDHGRYLVGREDAGCVLVYKPCLAGALAQVTAILGLPSSLSIRVWFSRLCACFHVSPDCGGLRVATRCASDNALCSVPWKRFFFFFFLFLQVLYPVGPGPSPARIARALVPTGMWAKLAMSIAVDTIGCTSYAVPVSLGVPAAVCASSFWFATVSFSLFPSSQSLIVAAAARGRNVVKSSYM